jgi:MarR family 2-MHQ and catechol resistance regulon transcriptional repressor
VREKAALDAYIKLTRAVGAMEARLARKNTMGDLTTSQFGVLESLYHLGPMRQGQISAKLLKSGGNMTLVVDNLRKQGLVTRERDQDDRRKVVVSLTEAGRELVAGLLPGHVAAIVDELSVLSAEEQAVLGNLCRRLGKRESPG